jgi:hypothetical protein
MLRQIQVSMAVVFVAASAVRADSIPLVESIKPDEISKISLTMKLNGEMVVVQGGKTSNLKLTASAEHRFRERVLAVQSSGPLPTKVARYYDDARAVINVDGGANPRTLRSERRLIVAQRPSDTLICYSPSGSLTREELDTVSEHFDTLALTGLLPGKSVAIGDTWRISEPVVQALCQFDGLVSHELTGKLSEVKDGTAIITVSGSAKGIELGAQVAVKIAATARFDLAKKRLAALEWKQSDVRDQGPASPAVTAETIVTISRESISESAELSEAAIAAVPQGFEIPDSLLRLVVSDVKRRFTIACSRDWQVTGQTEAHLVLRLIDRGEFVAQATITPWERAEAGKHTDGKAFREAMVAAPGWTFEELLQEGEIPDQHSGRWIYRVAARGQMDGIAVLQLFYLVAGPKGDQVVVAITFKPAQANKLGIRDAQLLDGLEFSGK